jgi:hypothetical protein
MPKYGVNILLYCQLIEAKDETELDSKINSYLDSLAETPDKSIIWESVQWDIEERYPDEDLDKCRLGCNCSEEEKQDANL